MSPFNTKPSPEPVVLETKLSRNSIPHFDIDKRCAELYYGKYDDDGSVILKGIKSYKRVGEIIAEELGRSRPYYETRVREFIARYEEMNGPYHDLYEYFPIHTVKIFLNRMNVRSLHRVKHLPLSYFANVKGIGPLQMARIKEVKEKLDKKEIIIKKFTRRPFVMKYVVIGDLHGHYNELMALYEKVQKEWHFNPVRYTFVFLGDYTDGGYKSKRVVEQLMRWQKLFSHWVFLKGNHEQMLTDAYYAPYEYHPTFNNWYMQGGKATILSYMKTSEREDHWTSRDIHRWIPKEHVEWLNSLPLYHETKKNIFVHAGINPYFWEKSQDMKKQSKDDLLWIRNEFINYKKDFGKKVIFGHTATSDFAPILMENKIGLDTMPRNEGKLTALLLPDEKILQVDSVTKEDPRWNTDRDKPFGLGYGYMM